MKHKQVLWITDPWDQLLHPKDTSLRLIEASLQNGIETYWGEARKVALLDGTIQVGVRRVLSVSKARRAEDFNLGPWEWKDPSQFQQIHFRLDPPVNAHFLHPLQFLARASSTSGTEIINPAEVLFSQNEKWEGAFLAPHFPTSCISADPDNLMSFLKRYENAVLKPLDDARGRGTQILKGKTSSERDESRATLEKLTSGFSTPVLLQVFLPQIEKGEIRLWYLDGTRLAQFRKFPLGDDFRVNVSGGSRIEATDLTKGELAVADKIATRLKELKIRLAAVDLVAEKIIDFNFTSPGLVVQMEALLQQDFAEPIVRQLQMPFGKKS